MSQYRVDLDIFAGPLDLLLYLVRKEEVDIYDIPIARITEQYMHYIDVLKLLDIDIAGEFLVMAATLMEIKSVMLLPRVEQESEQDGDDLDPRRELIRQLLEYKKFKDAAGLLRDSAQQRENRYTRPDTIVSTLEDQQDEPELDMEQVSVWSLLEAFDKLMQATGNYQKYDHITDDTPIDLYQIEILHRLQEEGPMSFANIFKQKQSRLVMVGLFLALLELIRSGLIWAEQPAAGEGIFLKAKTEEPAEQAVQNAIFRNEQDSGDPVIQSDKSKQDSASIPIVEVPAKKEAQAQQARTEPAQKTENT